MISFHGQIEKFTYYQVPKKLSLIDRRYQLQYKFNLLVLIIKYLIDLLPS